MKIVLLGYMASGKSTIGKLLANQKHVEFIDLDTYIEKRENASVKELFQKKGEIYFRKQETFYLQEILDSNKHFVLALGGGTPCYSNNMELIKTSTKNSVYLKATIPTLLSRLQQEKHQRPLVAEISEENLTEFIGKHLFERAPFYEQATISVKIDNKEIAEIVQEIEVALL